MSDHVQELLAQQDELTNQLKKGLINFKKSPKARVTKVYVEVRLKLIEAAWTKFCENHFMLINEEGIEDDSYIKQNAYEVAEDAYISAKCEMTEVLEGLSPVVSRSKPESPGGRSGTISSQPEIKLPRISLPSFSGKYSDWTSFHDLFVSMIDSNLAIQDVHKLHYLKSSVSGEAEALLRHIPVTESNYKDAWATLKKRYDNKRFIVNSLLKRFMSQRSITSESSQAIKMLLDTTNECLSAMKNVGIDSTNWDPILVYIIVTKLDSESVKLWEQHITSESDDNEYPTYKQLSAFLESRFRTLEVLETTKSASKAHTKQTAFHATLNTMCALCKGDHYIHNCKEFAKLSYTDRKNVVEKNSLCYNCLIPYHIVLRCKQKSKCRRCGKRHHSLLHPESKNNDQGPEGPSHKQTPEQPEIANVTVDSNVATHTADDLAFNVLLATALVKVKSKNGATHILRALIDMGSQGSFITESAAQILGLKKFPMNCTIKGLGNNGSSLSSNSMVIFNAYSRYQQNFATPVKAYVLKNLTRMLPSEKTPHNEDWSHLHQLELADPDYRNPRSIDLLLGADVYSDIVTEGLKKGPRGAPMAQNTHLGWILMGKLSNTETSHSYTNAITLSMHTCIEEDNLLQRFWEIESDVACKKILTEEESRCEKHFEETHSRDENGRYIVSLPFRRDNPSSQYGASREVARSRLQQLERRLEKDAHLKKEYCKVIEEYLKLDHMEEIKDEEVKNKPTAVYLPHHAVVRDDKTTTKVRVVHDASCKYRNGVSLNDDLMVGPRLQQDLRYIIMRWRQHKVCVVADIVKMFHQIKVSDPDFQRILWREDPKDMIKDYRITRVTFGTASAPYLAAKVLQQLALDESEKYPLASKITLKDYYMDDLLTGGDSFEDGVLIFKQMTELMKSGGFQLQKWNSNNIDLLQVMYGSKTNADEKELNLDSTIKTLGIVWDNKTDQFQYSIDLLQNEGPVTKRTIASDVSKLFDPMGWLAPTIVIGKIFLQRLWLSGVNWDQEVPKEIRDDWLKFRSELPALSEVTVKRWLHTTTKGTKMELYGFADASIMAYAAVVYSRVIDDKGEIHVQLISAKTRVAPIKTVSVPRLELCGAVLLTRLLNEVAEQLNVAKEDIYAYTDSKVVLSWLQGHPSKWKTFIANRTSEIISTLPSHHWGHVASKENPADLASRGVHASMLKYARLWWVGSAWLHEKEIKHEVPTDLHKESQIEERAVHFTNTEEEEKFTKIFERYSTLQKLLRVIATCKRFRYSKRKNYPTYLTAEEVDNALSVCILLSQGEEFAEDICFLKDNKPLKEASKLRSLNPFLDEKGILRVGGRLRNANIPLDAKHQIILSKDSPLSKLIIAQAHIKTLHGGPTLMHNYIRQRFWIFGDKSIIRKEVHKCVVCVRHRATTRTQIMADLPSVRVTPTRPFLHTGLDFAGPIDLRMSKGRGCKTYKGYLCIFICMVTRAIHIEIVSSLESESFVAAFKRFTARRGLCTDVWSDNATNFVAGNKLLQDLLKGHLQTVRDEFHDKISREGTRWHHIPASAPHFGGLWEAGVRSIKYHLKRVLGNSTLTFEEMSTVTSQIEACLNSRPISQISDNVDDLLPLTPGHFLIGEPPIVVPERSHLDTNICRLNRWQLVQRMVQNFWDRWSQEYLSRLQQRPKWVKKCDNENIKAGTLVLVKDDNLPPGKWSLARILDVHPGSDGLIRVVTLKCRNSVVKRPITKICLLPVEA